MRSVIRTDQAPPPAAAYEQAIMVGDLIFVSGQAVTDNMVGSTPGTPIGEQVTQVLRNIEAIVNAAGGNKQSIVRCGVFLNDLNDFAAMNQAFQDFFGSTLPARTTIQAGLGRLQVEIDAIAVRCADDRQCKSER